MAKSEIDITSVDLLARHLCERLPAATDEPAKKYSERIWANYLKIVNLPGNRLEHEEPARKKQFEKTVTSILKE